MKKYLYWLFFLLPVLANAQDVSVERNNRFLQSPNAAGLGIYGITDISPFTGLPDISIPVFSATQGDLTIKAELKYFGGGVKPEDHPGWVGQNWSLNVGGVITRKKNGELDEIYYAAGFDHDLHAYLYKYGGLGGGSDVFSWDKNTYMDPLFNSEVGQNQEYPSILSPDEFFFNLPNGKSGSFLLNYSGNWVVKCNQPGQLLVSVETVNGFILRSAQFPNKSVSIPRIIKKITITDDDGTVYIFGDADNSIEFIRGVKTITDDNSNIEANAWNLTKITSPTNNVVNFLYDRGEHQFVQNVGYGSILSYNIPGKCSGTNTIGQLKYSGQVITPSYLKEINAASFKAVFTRTESVELQYPYNNGVPQGMAFAGFAYLDFDKGNYGEGIYYDGQKLISTNPPKWSKLTGISVYNSKSVVKEAYFFTYNNDDASFSRSTKSSDQRVSTQNIVTPGTKRLFLQSFTKAPEYIVGETYLPQQTYAFGYDNSDDLPEYNSVMVDQWGYYNHKPYPNVGTFNLDDLKAKYVADSAYAKKGTLTKIIYPTGGWSEFTYELNDYSSYIKRNLNSVGLVTLSDLGGGLRIRKVAAYSDSTNFISKEYTYKSGQSPTVSSGVLAGWKQLYLNAQVGSNPKGYMQYVSNNSINDLNYTNGRDVVYSEVKEKMKDGSYTIYKYTNSDMTGYMDESPVYIYGAGVGIDNTAYGPTGFSFNPAYDYPFSAHTSRETERGQLLSKETYTGANTPVYKQINQYRDDVNRFAEYVRNYNYTQQKISCPLGYMIERYREPTKIYTYFPYMKSQTETTYDLNGGNPVATVKNFAYDVQYRLLKEESFVNSKGGVLKTAYTYPVDYVTEVYPAMKEKNVISPVIEKKTTRNDVQTAFTRTNYYQPAASTLPDFYAPKSIQGQARAIDPLDTLVKFHDYDNTNGNMISFSKALGGKTTYIWSYKRQYPVAKIENADYATVVAVLGGSSVVNTFSDSNPVDPQTFLAPLRTDARLKSAQITTYTYEPSVGMTSMTDPKELTTYYEYDAFQRLINVKDKDGNIIKHTDYHYQGQ